MTVLILKLTRLFALFVCFACSVLLNKDVWAHPHNWIQLKSQFVLNESAQLTEIKQSWEFDIFYSLMTYADILNEFGDAQTGLPKTADRMINNLKNYAYFSELSLDGKPVALGAPEQYRLSTIHQGEKVLLHLEMTFHIDELPKIEGKQIAWKVFDPTYYIAMNHASESDVEMIGGNATECSVELKYPEPSDALIEYAQSLDRMQRDTAGLGEQFAETAFIQCI